MSSRKNRAAPRLLCSVMQSPFVAEFVAELGVESAGDVDGQPPRRQRKAPQVAARTAPTWSHSLAAFAALRSIARRNPDPDGTPPPDSPARCPATPAGNRSTSRPLSLSLGRLRTVAPQGAVGPSGARTFGTVAGCRYAMSVVGETQAMLTVLPGCCRSRGVFGASRPLQLLKVGPGTERAGPVRRLRP